MDSGQLVCVTDSPCHRLASATVWAAARQPLAWLSPTSATVAVAWSAGTPKSHTSMPSWCSIWAHGALGRVGATVGVGTTS